MKTTLRPGQPFNPYRRFKGLFVPDGLARCTWISPGAKLAWGRLVRFAGKDGECFPTMKTLGAEIGVGERQAQKYRAELEKARLLRRVSRRVPGGRTVHRFEFLWHELFDGKTNDRSGKGANDDSFTGVNDRSPEESQMKESQDEDNNTDLDYLPLNRKNRDSPSGVEPQPAGRFYPKVREHLARYMQTGSDELTYPTNRVVVDIMEAAGTHDEDEVVQALDYLLIARGLKPFSKNGPRSFAWFKTVLQDHFAKKRERESVANPCGSSGSIATRPEASAEAMSGAGEVVGT